MPTLTASVVLAIDPGPKASGWCLYHIAGHVIDSGHVTNPTLLTNVRQAAGDACDLAIEGMTSYGMGVGIETFESLVWSGRFAQTFDDWSTTSKAAFVFRIDVKKHLLGRANGNDAAVRAALLDRFGPGKAAKGTAKNPGPLFGISGHAWAALAVAVTYADTLADRRVAILTTPSSASFR